MWRVIYGRPTRTKRYVLLGFVIGWPLGIGEAVVTSIGAANFWGTVKMHFSQFGFACPFLGAVLGYVIAQRIERAERAEALRRAQRLCRSCGYNLTGNTSGTCPECGRAVVCHG